MPDADALRPFAIAAVLTCFSYRLGWSQAADPAQIARETPAEAEVLGRATPGSVGSPRLELLGAPIVGGPFGFEVTHAPPGGTGFLILGERALAQPLLSYGAVLYPAGELTSEPFVVGADGSSGPIAPLGSVPLALWGSELVAQGVLGDPQAQGGLAFTHAGRVRFGSVAEQPLYPGPLYPTTGLGGPALGDFDADGNPDLVTTSYSQSQALVSFGSPAGLFSDPVEFPSQRAKGVASGDFDGDGLEDFVVANEFGFLLPSKVSVHLSRGDRTFEPAVQTQVGIQARVVLTGDLDGNGDIDVLAQEGDASRGLRLLGQGNGTFSQTGFSPAYAFRALRDMDLDGYLDLVGRTSTDVTVARGRGDATFEPPLASPSGGSSFELTIGSFDGDGIPDVGVAYQNTLAVLLGVGDGSFAAPIPRASPRTIDMVTTGDVNGDGRDDLVALHGDAQFGVSLGSGNGNLSAARVFPSHEFARGPLLTADLDRNGRADVVLLASAGLHVLYGVPDGLLAAPLASDLADNSFLAIGVADFDGDEEPDLVVGGGGPLHFAQGLGGGRFGPSHQIGTNSRGLLTTADLDADQREDVVYTDSVKDNVNVLLGEENGQFGPVTSFLALDGARLPVVLDLDLDGFLDLAVVGSGFLSKEVGFLYGRGDGTFEPRFVLDVGDNPSALAAADFTGDAVPDLAVGHSGNLPGVAVWQGSTDRTFTFLGRVDLPSYVVWLTARDLDSDGILDLVANSGQIRILIGLGNGSFELRTSVGSGGPQELVVADLDRNGELDIAACSSRGIEVLLGRGALSFDADVFFARSRGVQSLAALDLDRDFLPDLVALDVGGSFPTIPFSVRVFSNRLLRHPTHAFPAPGPVGGSPLATTER